MRDVEEPSTARLLVGCDYNEDLLTAESAGWNVQRLLWFAEDDDVLLLPVEPEAAFVDYVFGLTGVDSSTVKVVVPSSGDGAPPSLSGRRLRDPDLLGRLEKALDRRRITSVQALWTDRRVVDLASALGAVDALAGHRFFAEGGDTLANSKAVFRAVAAGVGLAIPEGAVCLTLKRAVDIAERLLTDGPIIVKHEFGSGGAGNDIVTTSAGLRPIGAARMAVLASSQLVGSYLGERWDGLTDGGRHALVVERYFPESMAVFAEFTIGGDGVRLGGQGQLMSLPHEVMSEIIPAVNIDPLLVGRVIEGGAKLCEGLRAIGYRGVLSADAIVTPHGEVYFTEYNGRYTGSTHTYAVIGEKLVGPNYADDCVIVERLETKAWSTSSFSDAVTALTASGLAYDPATRRGVIYVHPFDPHSNSVPYCVVAENPEAAADIEMRLGEMFRFAPPLP